MQVARIWLIGIMVTFIGTCSLARAEEWVGPDCLFSWDANPAEQLVQGYRIHIRNRGGDLVVIDASVGSATTTTCGAQGLTEGRYEAWVTAYNPAGESGPSEVVPFVLVQTAPGTPGGATSPSGFGIQSAGGGDGR